MYEVKKVEFSSREYEVSINNELFNKMKFDWNSYNFIDKDYLFLSMREVGSRNVLNLITYGFIIDFVVIDLKTNEEVGEWEEILKLSREKKLYDGSKEYFVDEGNWFNIDFIETSSVIDMTDLKEDYDKFFSHNEKHKYLGEDGFSSKPKNMEELLNVLISEYNNFFDKN